MLDIPSSNRFLISCRSKYYCSDVSPRITSSTLFFTHFHLVVCRSPFALSHDNDCGTLPFLSTPLAPGDGTPADPQRAGVFIPIAYSNTLLQACRQGVTPDALARPKPALTVSGFALFLQLARRMVCANPTAFVVLPLLCRPSVVIRNVSGGRHFGRGSAVSQCGRCPTPPTPHEDALQPHHTPYRGTQSCVQLLAVLPSFGTLIKVEEYYLTGTKPSDKLAGYPY